MAERTENLHIRLTPEEKKTLQNFAKIAGVSITELIIGILAGDNLGQLIIDNFKK